MPTKRPRSSQFDFRGEGKKRVTQPRADHASFSRGPRTSHFSQTRENLSAAREQEKPLLRSSARINEIRARNKAADAAAPPTNASASKARPVRRQTAPQGQRKPQRPSVVQRGLKPNNNPSQPASPSLPNSSLKRSRVVRDSAPRQRSNTAAIAEQNMSGHIWNQANQAPKKAGRLKAGSSAKHSNARSPFAGSRSSSGNNFTSPKGPSALHSVKVKRHFPTRIVLGILVVILLFAGATGIDSLLNGNKIYQGVSIGDVNVSGLTKDEAIQAVSGYYSPRVSDNVATFYTTQEAQDNPTTAENSESIEEQISYEESLDSRTQWTIPSSYLDTTFNVEDVVEKAYQVGRSNGNIIARIQASLNGWNIQPECTFNETTLSEILKEMTSAVGSERVNFNIEMNDEGIASVTSGHDGNEVVRDWLVGHLNETYFGGQTETKYVLETQYMPLQITEEIATKCADKVNASLSAGAVFSYEGQSWNASRTDLAPWIKTDVVQTGNTWDLKPLFDEGVAKKSLLHSLQSNIDQGDLQVTFSKDDQGAISVSSNATGTVPLVSDAINQMNDTFFVNDSRTEAPTIELSSTDLPSTMSFNDAIDFGLISEVSSFTTQYSSGAEARTNNIHTAANLLNNSIITANGGSWSFNDTAGEATEDKGYQNAGAIIGGDYSDAIGGGICQVATTVFNAIYDAGYPVTERHNHTLHIESYPEGRDAAIAYPYMDLVWENDSSSDVLLVMSYTNSSVTCTLWGVDPGYEVSTDYGDWQEGEPYSVQYRTDDTVASGTEYVETTGVNGSSISITRIVKDSDGKVLHEDLFESNYSPKNQVIVRGTA